MYSFITLFVFFFYGQLFIPIKSENRKDIANVQITQIGQFGLMRKARPNIPAHYHTGIDIKRPGKNYIDEPIYAIAEGKVISKRTDGAYANLIIEHNLNGLRFWSIYEHISGIKVNVNDHITPHKPIARFMNTEELNKYGWQFDHFHLEILKIKPITLKPDKRHPERFFNSYTLICYTPYELNKKYYNPIIFLKGKF